VTDPLRLLCVLAHPDDESLGCGGVLARSAAEGIETFVLTATLGERGRIFGERPGAAVAAPVRERELRAAAATLGVRELNLLGYLDGELDAAEPREAAARIAAHVRRIRPQVVVTFGAEGSYGHPDHIAISQLTGAALVAAADAAFAPPPGLDWPAAPHRVSKLYWMAWAHEVLSEYQRATGSALVSRVDGVERRAAGWPEWAITTRVDTREQWPTVWRAVQCHASQIASYRGFEALSPERHEELWGRQSFVRVWSLVNGGRETERDLFAGLRAR
jgi:LmbE family N-acetylglucosaminyl deacetylase